MGMYTEVFLRAEIKRGDSLIESLPRMIAAGIAPEGDGHNFFSLPRWHNVFVGASAYFPEAPASGLHFGRYPTEGPTLVVHGNLKNYDGEIEAFFDWINPHIEAPRGEFIGYSLYEAVAEFAPPTLYYRGGRRA